jgi:hypothetical protein
MFHKAFDESRQNCPRNIKRDSRPNNCGGSVDQPSVEEKYRVSLLLTVFADIVKQHESVSYPFHTPNIKPATVPNVDQPTRGGKETKNTHSHRIKAASQDVSHFSATGPSQMNNFPVNTMNAIPDAPTKRAAKTVPTFFHRVISSQILFIRTYNSVPRWII